MTTILTVTRANGSRRCDATCYNAHGPKCECVCGGKNHGAGQEQAVANMRELFGLELALGDPEPESERS